MSSVAGPKQESTVRQIPADQRTVARTKGKDKPGKLSRGLMKSRLVLGHSSAERRKLMVGFQAPEACLRLQHAGRRPSQSHRGIAPALQVPCHAADRALHILNRVGSGQRPAQLGRVIGQCKPRHRAKEFLSFLRKIDRAVKKSLDVHLVLDNYGTHKTPEVKAWLAKRVDARCRRRSRQDRGRLLLRRPQSGTWAQRNVPRPGPRED